MRNVRFVLESLRKRTTFLLRYPAAKGRRETPKPPRRYLMTTQLICTIIGRLLRRLGQGRASFRLQHNGITKNERMEVFFNTENNKFFKKIQTSRNVKKSETEADRRSCVNRLPPSRESGGHS